VLIVIPRSFSSGALSIDEKSRISHKPLEAKTVVIAAVNVVSRDLRDQLFQCLRGV